MITHAHAAGTSAGFDPLSLMPIVLIFVVFYFLILRPQQKKVKTHQEMLNNLKRGDKVVTNGGVIGSVSKIVSDDEVQLEIAEGVKIRMVRSMIAETVAKPEPVKAASNTTKKATTAAKKPAAKKTTTTKKTTAKKTTKKPSTEA